MLWHSSMLTVWAALSVLTVVISYILLKNGINQWILCNLKLEKALV